MSFTYRDAGVDRAAAAAAKERIREMVRSTFDAAVLGDFGDFGGCYRVDDAVLVASADGVGTKLKVAARTGLHDTVGFDLVAHCANDVLTQGALPLFFLDYLALGRLREGVVEEIVRGVVEGCRAVGAALLGGETAEMPDVYADGEYDLAGFIVGRVVPRGPRGEDAGAGPAPLDGSAIRPGDRLVALASDGLHTNGYSLARRLLFEVAGLDVDDPVEEWGRSVGEELLRVHRPYVAPLREPLRRGDLLGLAHVTGGGLPDNLPRMLPDGCAARIDRSSWEVPPVFVTLQEIGEVPDEDMWETFNMGVGMVAAMRPERCDALVEELTAAGETAWVLGEVVEGRGVELAAADRA